MFHGVGYKNNCDLIMHKTITIIRRRWESLQLNHLMSASRSPLLHDNNCVVKATILEE